MEIQSNKLFNQVAQKKFNEDTDKQLGWSYYMATNQELSNSEIVNSAEPVYTGRRLTSFKMTTYPAGIEFTLTRGTKHD